MLEGNAYHQGLRALLEFESTKHGQHIDYHEVSHLAVSERFMPRMTRRTAPGPCAG